MSMMSLMVALNIMASDEEKNFAHYHAQVVPDTLCCCSFSLFVNWLLA
jgi:hypothetical protein